MVSLNELRQWQQVNGQCVPICCCSEPLNLYDEPELTTLATQAATHRHLRILGLPPEMNDQRLSPARNQSIPVCLCEDDYPGWISLASLAQLQIATEPYHAPLWTATEIGDRIPHIIAYTKAAMVRPNYYLWGGTVGPSYDCSGLMQAAFCSADIWLPRDAYLQEPFTQSVALEELQPGDLIFFGPKQRANHVALYLGEGFYIHSSGTSIGRNGIGIDRLLHNNQSTLTQDPISQAYWQQVHGAGRVTTSYQPTGKPMKPIDCGALIHG